MKTTAVILDLYWHTIYKMYIDVCDPILNVSHCELMGVLWMNYPKSNYQVCIALNTLFLCLGKEMPGLDYLLCTFMLVGIAREGREK